MIDNSQTVLNKPSLSPKRRELIVRVMNDEPRVLPLIFHIQMMRRCDEALQWMIDNHLTGTTFHSWFKEVQEGSPLKLIAFLKKQINRSRDTQPVFGQVDLL